MAKSPSITILERNMSTFTVTSSETVLAVVGYATKGPIGKATIVKSRTEFNEVFGTPVDTVPYSALAVYRAFNQGNQVIFYRVAGADATAADMSVTNPIGGTAGYWEIIVEAAGFAGLTPATTYYLRVTVNGTLKNIAFTGAATFTRQAIADIILAEVAGTATVTLPDTTHIRITNATSGIAGTILVQDGATSGVIAADSNTTVVGSYTAGTNPTISTMDAIRFTAKEKGTSTNKIAIQKTSRVNPITLATIHTITVWYDGVLKETYDDISLIVGATNFFETVINADPDNGGSNWVTVDYQDPEGTGIHDTISFPDNTSIKPFYVLGVGTTAFVNGYTIGQYDYKVGSDGIVSDEGDQDQLFVDALSTTGDLGNSEEYDFHILITPDVPTSTVQNAALALADFRKDFMYLVDPPMSSTYSQVILWHNGKSPSRTTPLNNSYGALYWSWLKDYNAYSKEYVWCPPSVFMAEKLMEIDRNYGPWYAPAGDSRGRIVASDYEVSPSFAQREELYGDFNAVNPFVNFSSKGLLVYGQKTLLRENSALNRVNTRRMVIYIKKLVKRAMDSMLFEPHNPDSWRKAAGKITAILEPIRQANGLDQYLVTVDGTTNTPDLTAQSIMKGIIKLVPTGTIEIIELTLQVNASGSTLSE